MSPFLSLSPLNPAVEPKRSGIMICVSGMPPLGSREPPLARVCGARASCAAGDRAPCAGARPPSVVAFDLLGVAAMLDADLEGVAKVDVPQLGGRIADQGEIAVFRAPPRGVVRL